MKQVCLAMLVVLLSASIWGQAAPAQNSAPQPQSSQGAPMHHGMHHQMMQHHMPDMKAQLDTMRTKIADLKTNLVRVKDPATKQALQADLDLWQSMAAHMEAMQKMMPRMGPGMAMNHDEADCPCCAEMMKEGDMAMACCGGNKCMQNKPNAPITPEPPAPPAN
jgi:TolA-binding protein